MLWKKILGSTIVRIWIAIVGFASLLLSARFLGAEGRGEISLLIANIAMLQLIIDIANGLAMIYLVPKIPLKSIFTAGIIWLLIISSCSFCTLYFLLSDQGLTTDLISLSFLFSVSNLIQLILQGQNKIMAYNLSIFLQQSVLLVGLLTQFFILENKSTEAFILCLYLSHGSGILAAFFLIGPWRNDGNPLNWNTALKKMLHDGWKAQLSNVLNFFNSRLSYYIIVGFFFDATQIGKYATAIALSESVWIVSYSLSAVQYPALTRTTRMEAEKITCGLSKLTLYLSSLALLFLIALPADFYQALLGKEFNETGSLLLLLAPGIVFIAIHKIFWNYFAALGKFHTNNLSNAVSLVLQIPFLFILLNWQGLNGAAIAASISGAAAMLSLLIYFKKNTSLTWLEILPGKNDWSQVLYVWNFRNS
jgi:O-antigen/teichoic acid export membrane protein